MDEHSLDSSIDIDRLHRNIGLYKSWNSNKMSVYSGFATRALESNYNRLLC